MRQGGRRGASVGKGTTKGQEDKEGSGEQGGTQNEMPHETLAFVSSL